MAIISGPVIAGLLIGAGLGATAGALAGPEEEPLWKKLLVGGSLGAVAGASAGAAAPAGAAGTTTGAGLSAGASTVPAAEVGYGTVLAAGGGTGAGIAPTVGTGLATTTAAPIVGEFGVLAPTATTSPLLTTSGGALVPEAVNTSIMTEGALASPSALDVVAAGGPTPYTVSPGVAPAQTALAQGPATPTLGGKFLTGAGNLAKGVGKFAVKHPLMTLGGLGAAGQLISDAVEDGDDRPKNRSFKGKASWEEDQAGSSDRRRTAFRGGVQQYNYTGGVGRRFFA